MGSYEEFHHLMTTVYKTQRARVYCVTEKLEGMVKFSPNSRFVEDHHCKTFVKSIAYEASWCAIARVLEGLGHFHLCSLFIFNKIFTRYGFMQFAAPVFQIDFHNAIVKSRANTEHLDSSPDTKSVKHERCSVSLHWTAAA